MRRDLSEGCVDISGRLNRMSGFWITVSELSAPSAKRDRRQDAKNLPRKLDRIFHDVHGSARTIQFQEPPHDARGDDPMNVRVGLLLLQVEPPRRYHLGEALRDAPDDVLVFRLSL